MQNIPTLTHIILITQSIENLYNIYKSHKIINIEREIERRLISCDVNLINPVINFLFMNINDIIIKEDWLKSIHIKNGINGAIHCVPWKIAVIYDYTDQSYNINNIQVMLGNKQKNKTRTGKQFKPTWLNADKTKLILREIISSNSTPINNVISKITHDTLLDRTIRYGLMNNEVVTITTCLFLPPPGAVFHSFPEFNYLPDGETKQIYPCFISVGNFNHKLINYPGNIMNYFPQVFRVSVAKSENYLKLFHLYQVVNT